MKFLLLFSAVWTIFFGNSHLQAEQKVYVNYDHTERNPITQRQREAAASMPECQPAEKDPLRWGPATNGLQFSLRFPTNTFAAGMLVEADFIARNISDEVKSGNNIHPMFDYEIIIHDADRQRVPMTPEGRQMLRGETEAKGKLFTGYTPRVSLWYLPVGCQEKEQLPISKWFEVGKPGKYEITVVKKFPDARGKIQFEARSNTCELEVVKKSP